MEFPGNIQGRDVGETGAKGCLLVTVDAHWRADPQFRPLDVFRWAEVPVDSAAAESREEAMDAAVKALADARDQAEGRPLAARVILSCCEAVHRQIAENMTEFRFDLAGQAGPGVWVEKVKLALVGEEQRVVSTVTGDAASELRAVLAEFRSDPAAAKGIFSSGDCGRLRKLLPLGIRDVREISRDGISEEVRELFDANRDDIFDRAATLLSGGGKAEDDA